MRYLGLLLGLLLLGGCAAPGSPRAKAAAFVADLLQGDCAAAYQLAPPSSAAAEAACAQGMPQIVQAAYSCWPLKVGSVHAFLGDGVSNGGAVRYYSVQVQGFPHDVGFTYTSASDPNPDPRYGWVTIGVALERLGARWYVNPAWSQFQHDYNMLVIGLERSRDRC